MARKIKMKNYIESEGTYHFMADECDKANQTRADETDIKLVIEKYGILPLEMLNKASENLYLNNLGENMTLNERLKEKEKIDTYFQSLPAAVRKQFNDNPEILYQSIMTGEYDKLLNNNILSEDQINNINEQKAIKERQINELKKELNSLQIKLGEYENGNFKQENQTTSTMSTNSD